MTVGGARAEEATRGSVLECTSPAVSAVKLALRGAPKSFVFLVATLVIGFIVAYTRAVAEEEVGDQRSVETSGIA